MIWNSTAQIIAAGPFFLPPPLFQLFTTLQEADFDERANEILTGFAIAGLVEACFPISSAGRQFLWGKAVLANDHLPKGSWAGFSQCGNT